MTSKSQIWVSDLNARPEVGAAFPKTTVRFYDTTLRDGEQTVGVVLSPQQKLEMRPGFSIPAAMRWPALGANLSLASVTAKEPKIEFTREKFAVSEAITYYEYTLESAIAQGL